MWRGHFLFCAESAPSEIKMEAETAQEKRRQSVNIWFSDALRFIHLYYMYILHLYRSFSAPFVRAHYYVVRCRTERVLSEISSLKSLAIPTTQLNEMKNFSEKHSRREKCGKASVVFAAFFCFSQENSRILSVFVYEIIQFDFRDYLCLWVWSCKISV